MQGVPVKSQSKPKHQIWKQLRDKPTLRLSATQIETFDTRKEEGCNRKWWLDAVRGLPRPPVKDSAAFGTVLHGVAERYLKANDLGQDEDGAAVDMYPEGWHIARNRFTGEVEGEVTPDEQDRIKRMIAKAIEAGILERHPHRQVERAFELEVDDASVVIAGFIDLSYPTEVQDHKTSKNPRYFKSQNALRGNTQMLIYAKALLEEHRRIGAAFGPGTEDPPLITLRHNQYCTDPDNIIVRKTSVEVTPAEIDAEWEHIRRMADEMQQIRQSVDEWHQIPDPPNPARACNAYGGCQFQSICYGQESVEGYIHRLTQVTVSAPPLVRTITGDSLMGFTDRMRAIMAGANGAAQGVQTATMAPPPLNPTAPPVRAGQPALKLQEFFSKPETRESLERGCSEFREGQLREAAPAPEAPVAAPVATDAPDTPPWASPEKCKACIGNPVRGFSSNGSPCRICDTWSQREGRPTSTMFIIEPVGDGSFVWEPRPGVGAVAGTAPTPSAATPVQTQEKVAVAPAPALAPALAPVAAVAPAPVAATAPAPAATAVAPAPVIETDEDEDESAEGRKSAAGRPRKGFILCINCLPTKGMAGKSDRKKTGRGVHYLHEVLVSVGKAMVQQRIAEQPSLQGSLTHYTQINAFDRRDYIRSIGEHVVQSFGTDFVVASGIGTGESDMRAMLDAVRPFAGMEVHPDGLTA